MSSSIESNNNGRERLPIREQIGRMFKSQRPAISPQLRKSPQSEKLEILSLFGRKQIKRLGR